MLGLLGFSLAFAGIAAPGPCDLVSKDAASALLEAPVTKMEPGGPERDEDTGGMRTLCAYMAGTRMLIVVREVFASGVIVDHSNDDDESEPFPDSIQEV